MKLPINWMRIGDNEEIKGSINLVRCNPALVIQSISSSQDCQIPWNIATILCTPYFDVLSHDFIVYRKDKVLPTELHQGHCKCIEYNLKTQKKNKKIWFVKSEIVMMI